METLLLVTSVVLGSIAVFFGYEFRKKFLFMDKFAKFSGMEVSWYWSGTGGERPRMANIVLKSETKKPFIALVGFTLHVPIPVIGGKGFDYYGIVESDGDGVAVVSTWFGRKAVLFRFLVNCDPSVNRVIAFAGNGADRLKPHVVYPPKPYQRIGFYG